MKRSVRKDCTSGRNLLMKYVPLELKKGLSVFLSILLLGTILPASSMAASIPSRSLRPIPYSPPPCESIRTAQKEAEANPEEAKKPKELVNKRTKNSKKYLYSSGIYSTKTYPRAIHKQNDKGGWEEIDENKTKPLSFLPKFATWVNEQAQPGTPPIYPKAQGGAITPLSLCLYAGGSSFDQNGTQSYEQMSLSNYTIGGQTFTNDTYLRYPNLRDLIPEDATLTT